MGKLLTQLSRIDKDEAASIAMREDRDNLNNFSFWFPKIRDCGMRVPRSIIFHVPDSMYTHMFMEHIDEDMEAIFIWVSQEVLPIIRERYKANAITSAVFLKNARFSNKFTARYCRCNVADPYEISVAMANINYAALCLGAGGFSELIAREYINHDSHDTAEIYSGLPLVPEFRCFYDFDSHQPMYTVNYWEYGYVYPHLYSETDRIIFKHKRKFIEREFTKRKDEVTKLVSEHVSGVTGLLGQWSIDVMLRNGTYWLIDMALAQASAYFRKEPSEEPKARPIADIKVIEYTAEQPQAHPVESSA